LSALASHSERAIVTFLDHFEFWEGATLFYHADSLSYWRKRKNLPHSPIALGMASREELAQMISNYFHHAEGRGKNCVVELLRRGERDYFFAYPEDYSQESIEWVQGEFARRPHNPAFEVIYLYSEKEGSLDLNFRGPRKNMEPLQEMFATAILKLDKLPTDPDDERVYDLSPLLSRDFSFVFDTGSGIQGVSVKRLRLSSRIKKGDRITLEANVSYNSKAVYDLLDKISKFLSLSLYTSLVLPFHTSSTSRLSSNSKKRYFSGSGLPASIKRMTSCCSCSVSFAMNPLAPSHRSRAPSGAVANQVLC